MTRAVGGKIYLRIDDLDLERTRKQYVEDIFKTLEWLELDYDFGPSGVADFYKNFSQHHRIDIYTKYLNKLVEKNEVYACPCSRQEIRELSPSGKYPQTCRHLNIPLDTPETAWRIKLPLIEKRIQFNNYFEVQKLEIKTIADDFVVRQKNGLPAYHLASVVDDCMSPINFIFRGEDLFESTAAQIYLAEQIELNSFRENIFLHLPILTDSYGTKISKSVGAANLWKLERTEEERAFIFSRAAQWLNISTPHYHAREVLKAYQKKLFKA